MHSIQSFDTLKLREVVVQSTKFNYSRLNNVKCHIYVVSEPIYFIT